MAWRVDFTSSISLRVSQKARQYEIFQPSIWEVGPASNWPIEFGPATKLMCRQKKMEKGSQTFYRSHEPILTVAWLVDALLT